jgi:hypothetical protein
MDGEVGTGTDDRGAQSPCSAGRSILAFVTRAALPSRTTVTVPVLGDVTVAVEDRQIRSEQAANLAFGCHGVGLSLFGASAVLWIERGFARLTVDTMLGRQPSIVVCARELSRVERGLLQGAAAALAMAVGLPPSLGLGPAAEGIALGPLVLSLRIEMAGTVGHAWLGASEEFAKQVLRAEWTVPQVVVELSRTMVARAEIASASVDDVIVFDDVLPLPACDRWPVLLRIGDRVARAELFPDGKVTMLDGRYGREEATKVDRRGGHAPSEPTAAGAEIVAEIARFAGAQLADWMDRPVLSRSTGVTLRMADARWAEGHITSLDGCLAVRLTKRLAS